MKRPLAFHPPLFALHPPLALYAANVSLIPLSDTVVPMLACVGAAIGCWAILGLVLRSANRAASAVSVFAYALFLFGWLEGALKDWGFFNEFMSPHTRAIVIWLFFALGLATLAAWKWKAESKVTTFLNIAGSAMVALALFGIVRSDLNVRSQISEAERHLGVSKSTGVSQKSKFPDIFYIILDGYGRQDVLSKYYSFDNAPFIDSLEGLGFYVAGRARPNYVQTELSLSSSLNLGFVQDLTKSLKIAEDDRGVLDAMIDDSLVSRKLKSRGYRYFAIGTGFPALVFHHADIAMQSDSGRSLYLSALLEKTPFRPSSEDYQSMMKGRYDVLNGAFANIERLAEKGPTPRFVFVHVLAPHPPFVMGADGGLHIQRMLYGFWDGSHYMEKVGTPQSYKEGYIGQLQAINRLALRAVKTLISSSDKPVIILQGDHGPKMRLDQGSLEKTDLGEVGGILAAYFVPDEVRERLYPSITPVNALRSILSQVLGEELPKLPDRTFYSTWDRPLDFTDVTSKLDALFGTSGEGVSTLPDANSAHSK